MQESNGLSKTKTQKISVQKIDIWNRKKKRSALNQKVSERFFVTSPNTPGKKSKNIQKTRETSVLSVRQLLRLFFTLSNTPKE